MKEMKSIISIIKMNNTTVKFAIRWSACRDAYRTRSGARAGSPARAAGTTATRPVEEGWFSSSRTMYRGRCLTSS